MNKCDVCGEDKNTLSALSDEGKFACRECREKMIPVLFKGVPSLQEALDTMAFIRFHEKSIEALFTYYRKKATYLHEPYDVLMSKVIDELKELSIFILKKELFTLDMREHHYILSMYMSKIMQDALYETISTTTIKDGLILMDEKKKYMDKFMAWKFKKF